MPGSRIEGARAWFEDLLAQVLGTTPDLLKRDHEGDYLIQLADNHRMYVRLAPGELDMGTPDRAQVFSVLAEGVEATLELLTELNDLNASIGPARIFLIGGQILIETEPLLHTLDAAELRDAYQTVARVTTHISPMLRAVHGGRQIEV